MATSSKLAEVVEQMLTLDESGKVTGPEWSAAEQVYRDILEGGPDQIAALAAMIVPPGEGDDCKARYLMHGLALYVCRPAGAGWRDVFLKAVAALVAGDSPKPVRSFLVQQLQVAGTRDVADSLGTLLLDEGLCESAAQALLAIRDGAAEQFRRAAPRARGKTRLTIAQALGVLRDAPSVEILVGIAADPDRDSRLAALAALADIGDPATADLLIRAADVAEGWERIQATEACLVLADRLIVSGHKEPARRIYTHLRETRSDPSESHVRDAAERALATAG